MYQPTLYQVISNQASIINSMNVIREAFSCASTILISWKYKKRGIDTSSDNNNYRCILTDTRAYDKIDLESITAFTVETNEFKINVPIPERNNISTVRRIEHYILMFLYWDSGNMTIGTFTIISIFKFYFVTLHIYWKYISLYSKMQMKVKYLKEPEHIPSTSTFAIQKVVQNLATFGVPANRRRWSGDIARTNLV